MKAQRVAAAAAAKALPDFPTTEAVATRGPGIGPAVVAVAVTLVIAAGWLVVTVTRQPSGAQSAGRQPASPNQAAVAANVEPTPAVSRSPVVSLPPPVASPTVSSPPPVSPPLAISPSHAEMSSPVVPPFNRKQVIAAKSPSSVPQPTPPAMTAPRPTLNAGATPVNTDAPQAPVARMTPPVAVAIPTASKPAAEREVPVEPPQLVLQSAMAPLAPAPETPVATSRSSSWRSSVVYSEKDADVIPPISYDEYLSQPPPPESRYKFVAAIDIVVNESGRVETATLLKRPANIRETIFATMSLSAAKMWRFDPARKDGEPVKYRQRAWLLER